MSSKSARSKKSIRSVQSSKSKSLSTVSAVSSKSATSRSNTGAIIPRQLIVGSSTASLVSHATSTKTPSPNTAMRSSHSRRSHLSLLSMKSKTKFTTPSSTGATYYVSGGHSVSGDSF